MRKIKARKFARARAANESWMAAQEDKRRVERAARLSNVPLGEPVPVPTVIVEQSYAARIERLAHEASDRSMAANPVIAALDARLRAELDEILADGAGLVETDGELLV